MGDLFQELNRREAERHPVRVGIIGAGQMGFGLAAQIPTIPGMVITGICDHTLSEAEKAKARYLSLCRQPNEVVTSEDYRDIVNDPSVEVVIEATGRTEVGAQVSMAALLAKKHLVLLNVEVDITIGPLMKRFFDAAGLIYTGSDGDEPAATFALYRFAQSMGMEILAIGKGKNNKVQLEANPDSARAEAEERHMSPVMLASFQDGTKTMAEMTLLSNATGFVPDVVGMHGIVGDLDETVRQLDLKERGGILNRYGIVDYVDGLAPGAFVIVKPQNQGVADVMEYMMKEVGQDHHILYRPYHLGSLETSLTAARAVLFHDVAIAPMGSPISETVAVAKKEIHAGEILDEIGGFCVRGVIEEHAEQRAKGHLPIGIITGHTVAKRDIAKGTFLTAEDVDVDSTTMVSRLRGLQDALFG